MTERDYIRDGAEIYRRSFAIIRAESDLARFTREEEQVAVRIIHTYRGDLKVDLIAPNGSVFTLSNRAGGAADNIITTYTVNASASVANGTWRLRVNDNAAGDVGYIDSWSLQF